MDDFDAEPLEAQEPADTQEPPRALEAVQLTFFDTSLEADLNQPGSHRSNASSADDPAESSETSPRKPGRATGPRTLSGKAKSALNRLTHGCRSQKAVLPHEDPAEYAATVQNWFDQYDPQDHDEITLVEETALAHWHLQRASKRLADIEIHLPGNAWNWTPEHQQLFSTFSRYKTTAERSLVRWYKELEAYQGRELHFEQARESLRAKTAAAELAWIKGREKSVAPDLKVTQLVQVENREGRSVTSYYPTNQQILDDCHARPSKPLLLQRVIEFPNGVPPDYSWACPDAMQRITSCSAVQRFIYSEWLKAIEREKSTGNVGPISILPPGSLPPITP